jgi:hypothetical protein
MKASESSSFLASKSHEQQQQQQAAAEQNQVTQQHLSYLQAPFDLSSPPFSSLSDQAQLQQAQQYDQQRPQATPIASANFSTPEAHWSE